VDWVELSTPATSMNNSISRKVSRKNEAPGSGDTVSRTAGPALAGPLGEPLGEPPRARRVTRQVGLCSQDVIGYILSPK
jgi:hypothetical protein